MKKIIAIGIEAAECEEGYSKSEILIGSIDNETHSFQADRFSVSKELPFDEILQQLVHRNEEFFNSSLANM